MACSRSSNRPGALGRRQDRRIRVAFFLAGTGDEKGAGAEQLGTVGLPFDGAVERLAGQVEPALPLDKPAPDGRVH